MQEYVVGFLFSTDYHHVVMIRKAKPDWQAGKLNGVGGKIEPGETPLEAMIREGMEEMGVEVPWSPFARLTYSAADLYFFAAADAYSYAVAQTCEAEPIEKWAWRGLLEFAPLADDNLRWLVPLALYHLRREKPVVGTLTLGLAS